MEIILETDRLYLRKLAADDLSHMGLILQDPAVMYAWEHTFTDDEVKDWLAENLRRYEADGYSYWAAITKTDAEFIGMMGLLAETADEEEMLSVGYLLNRNYWGRGYATEGITGCINYAFTVLNAPEVCAQIRPENRASRKVAERCGMRVKGRFVRQYRGKAMPHLIYSIANG